MKLKDLIIEKDLESDMSGLKADAHADKYGSEPETGIEGSLDVDVTYTEDEDPKEFEISITYDEIDEDEIEITDYDDIPNVDKKLLGSAINQVNNKINLKDGIWISTYDADYGTN